MFKISKGIVSEIRMVFKNTPAIKIFLRKVNTKELFMYYAKNTFSWLFNHLSSTTCLDTKNQITYVLT